MITWITSKEVLTTLSQDMGDSDKTVLIKVLKEIPLEKLKGPVLRKSLLTSLKLYSLIKKLLP